MGLGMKTVVVTTPTVTVVLSLSFSGDPSRAETNCASPLPANELVVSVVDDAGTEVNVDVSDERDRLAGTDVRVAVGVHCPVLPGVAVKEMLLHEKPVLPCVQNVDDPPDGTPVPLDGNMPDDQGVEDVVRLVPVVLGIGGRDDVVLLVDLCVLDDDVVLDRELELVVKLVLERLVVEVVE